MEIWKSCPNTSNVQTRLKTAVSRAPAEEPASGGLPGLLCSHFFWNTRSADHGWHKPHSLLQGRLRHKDRLSLNNRA
jgi:hypothetical protein